MGQDINPSSKPVTLDCPSCGSPCETNVEGGMQKLICSVCGLRFVLRAEIAPDQEKINDAYRTLKLDQSDINPKRWFEGGTPDVKVSGPGTAFGRSAKTDKGSMLILPNQNTLIGKILGGCRIDKLLGAGAMGSVYLAHHMALDIPVAMKVMNPSLSGGKADAERFIREARSAAKLSHQNIVNVLNVGQEDGVYFITMEFVDGTTLEQYLKTKGSLNTDESTKIMKQVMTALEVARTAGVIHRDIKPDNIMLDKKGVVKLADLGVAKSVSSNEAGLTMAGMVLGTPIYMAPEQASGDEGVDHRSDLYAAGVMYYRLVTGKVPYDGDIASILYNHMHGPIPDPRTIKPDIPVGVSAIIRKLMAKLQKDRYQTAHEVIDDLQSLSTQTVEIPAPARDTQAQPAESMLAPRSSPPARPLAGHRVPPPPPLPGAAAAMDSQLVTYGRADSSVYGRANTARLVQETQVSLDKARILLVEDSTAIRNMMSRLLKAADAEVFEATHGREALDLLRTQAASASLVELVLTDLDMPELDGVGMLQEIRSDPLLDRLPVVVVSTESQEELLQACRDLGVSGFLPKPCPKKQILDTVHGLIREIRASRTAGIEPGDGLSLDELRQLKDLLERAVRIAIDDGDLRIDSVDEEPIYAMYLDFLGKRCPEALKGSPASSTQALRIRATALVRKRAASTTNSMPAAGLQNVHILLVEDSKAIRNMMIRTLKTAGAVCSDAEHGQQALALLEQQAANHELPAMILTDLDMPVMNGVELLRALRAHPTLSALPVVVVSTESQEDMLSECRALGISGYLPKPSPKKDILETVQRILATGGSNAPLVLTFADVVALKDLVERTAEVATQDGITGGLSVDENPIRAIFLDFLEKHCPGVVA